MIFVHIMNKFKQFGKERAIQWVSTLQTLSLYRMIIIIKDEDYKEKLTINIFHNKGVYKK